jgi:hypothetical protein
MHITYNKQQNQKGETTVLELDDWILLKNEVTSDTRTQQFVKFMPLYGGPYKIIAKLHPNTYQIAAGSLNRLQMKIKGDAPKALFTHCCAHRLNLVLQNLNLNIYSCLLQPVC